MANPGMNDRQKEFVEETLDSPIGILILFLAGLLFSFLSLLGVGFISVWTGIPSVGLALVLVIGIVAYLFLLWLREYRKLGDK